MTMSVFAITIPSLASGDSIMLSFRVHNALLIKHLFAHIGVCLSHALICCFVLDIEVYHGDNERNNSKHKYNRCCGDNNCCKHDEAFSLLVVRQVLQ